MHTAARRISSRSSRSFLAVHFILLCPSSIQRHDAHVGTALCRDQNCAAHGISLDGQLQDMGVREFTTCDFIDQTDKFGEASVAPKPPSHNAMCQYDILTTLSNSRLVLQHLGAFFFWGGLSFLFFSPLNSCALHVLARCFHCPKLQSCILCCSTKAGQTTYNAPRISITR